MRALRWNSYLRRLRNTIRLDSTSLMNGTSPKFHELGSVILPTPSSVTHSKIGSNKQSLIAIRSWLRNKTFSLRWILKFIGHSMLLWTSAVSIISITQVYLHWSDPICLWLATNGSAAHLLKVGSKRRRTKEELQNERDEQALIDNMEM